MELQSLGGRSENEDGLEEKITLLRELRRKLDEK